VTLENESAVSKADLQQAKSELQRYLSELKELEVVNKIF
jgi:hypothetical protein